MEMLPVGDTGLTGPCLQFLMIWALVAHYSFGHTILAMETPAYGDTWLTRPRLQLLMIWTLLAHHSGMPGHTNLAMEMAFLGEAHSNPSTNSKQNNIIPTPHSPASWAPSLRRHTPLGWSASKKKSDLVASWLWRRWSRHTLSEYPTQVRKKRLR